MKKLILVLVVLVAALAIWRGYVSFNNTGDSSSPSVTASYNKDKVDADKEKAKEVLAADAQKAKDMLHKETAPSQPISRKGIRVLAC